MSELVHTSSKQCDRPLNFSDRNIGHDVSSATVCVRTSKTNQSGPPVFLRIPSEACNIICPVRALIKFLHNCPPSPGLLFVHENYRPLKRYQFNAVLTKTIKYLNLPLREFKSHSFRIGRATSLAMLWVPDNAIKQADQV